MDFEVMKTLFNRYSFFVNELSILAFELGYTGNLSMLFCRYLNIKGKPTYPSRKLISVKEMNKLLNLAHLCYDDFLFFLKVLYAKPH